MWRAVCIWGVAACYSGRPHAGAPCTPELANCPGEQTCQLVAGNYICVVGLVADASVADDPVLDAGLTDGAANDAAFDAAMFGPWTLVQTRDVMGSQLAVPATGAAHLLVVGVQTEDAGAATAVTDNAGNTYVAIAGSRAIVTGGGLAVELWYAKDSKAGATTITASAPTVYSVVLWEVAGISVTNPFDKVAQLSNQGANATPAAPSITTTRNGELIVAIAIVANAVNGVVSGSPFTNDHMTHANGWAHLTNALSPAGAYQAKWNQPTSGVYCATAAAFVTAP